MKKIALFLFAAIVLLPSAVSAREVVRLTRFAGERLAGVAASNRFEVVLVKTTASRDNRAVVEIDKEYEPYLVFEKSSGGRVSVGLRELPRSLQRNWDNTVTMKLTLFLSELDYVSLSGVARLSVEGEGDVVFSGQDVLVKASGSSSIKNLSVNGPTVKVECAGASLAKVNTNTERLTALISGSSRVEIASNGNAYAKVTASGASNLTLRGDAQEAVLNANGSASLRGEEFLADRANVTASGASSVRIWVRSSIKGTASGSASVRYKGNPQQVNGSKSGAGAFKAM